MDISYYFVSNIPLFAGCIVIVFLAIRNIRVRKLESINFLLFAGLVMVLFTVVLMENYSSYYGLPKVGTVFTSLGYITRPILLYVFLLIANMGQKREKWFYILVSVLLGVNTIVYMFPLFFGVEGLSTAVFSYRMLDNGQAEFVRGTTFLNYSSHIVSVILLILLVTLSIFRFSGKHRRDGWVFIVCAFVILATVLAEMFTSRSDLLNIICVICALINYIFIMSVNSLRDPLTELYNRETYYTDVSRYKNLVNGIVQIDMNELKFLNDNYGHGSGDKALRSIAKILVKSINPANMCAYRLSGDEYLILMFQGSKEQLDNTINCIKELMAQSEYSIAIGSYYIDKKTDKTTFEEGMRLAEKEMYKDKGEFYRTSGHERRGRN